MEREDRFNQAYVLPDIQVRIYKERRAAGAKRKLELQYYQISSSLLSHSSRPRSSTPAHCSISPSKRGKAKEESKVEFFKDGVEFVVRESTVKVVHKALLEYGVGLRGSSSPRRRRNFADGGIVGGQKPPEIDAEALEEVEKIVGKNDFFQGSAWEEEIKRVRRESVIMDKKEKVNDVTNDATSDTHDASDTHGESDSDDDFVDARGGITPENFLFAKSGPHDSTSVPSPLTSTNDGSNAVEDETTEAKEEATNLGPQGVFHVNFEMPGIMVRLLPTSNPSRKTLQNPLSLSITGVKVKSMFNATQSKTTTEVEGRVGGVEVREKGGNGPLPCWVYLREPTSTSTSSSEECSLALSLKVSPSTLAIYVRSEPLLMALDYECCRRVHTFLVPSITLGRTSVVLEDNTNSKARNSSADLMEKEEAADKRIFDANFSIGEITLIVPTERYDASKPCFEAKLGIKSRWRDSPPDESSRREEKIEITKVRGSEERSEGSELLLLYTIY